MQQNLSQNDNKVLKGIKILAIMPFVVFFVSFILYSGTRYNDHEYTITIIGKKHELNHPHNEYIVHGIDENNNLLTVKNVNSYYRMKFNSVELQEQLKEGRTYRLVVVGHRHPFLDMYENIIKVQEVKKTEELKNWTED